MPFHVSIELMIGLGTASLGWTVEQRRRQRVGELKAQTTGCELAYSVRTGTSTHGAVHASSKL